MMRMRLLMGAVLLLAAMGAGACNKPACEKTCQRLANCRLAAKQGERMMGERALPPDAACMKKCAEGSDSFKACEETKRECDQLLLCAGQ